MEDREALNKWRAAKDAKAEKHRTYLAARFAYEAAKEDEDRAWRAYCDLLRGSEGKSERQP